MEAEELRKKVPALEARIKELESFLGSLGFGNDAQEEVAQLRNLLAAQIAGRNEAETQLGEQREKLRQFETWGVIEVAIRNPNVASYCREWEGRVLKLEREVDALRRELVAHREKAQGNYWAWQGDGSDHVESLVCPVLIPAEDLKELLEFETEIRKLIERAKK